MPLTPFLGLSLIVHMCIIAGHKLFSWIPVGEKNQKPATPFVHIVGFTIIGVVFSFVLSTAFILVHASITDKHSSIRIVDAYISGLFTKNLNPNLIAGSASAMSSQKVLHSVISADCKKLFLDLAGKYNGSLVDYLALHSMDFSFNARQTYAALFVIGNYMGTAEQNQVLLMRFFIESKELPSAGTISCGI